MKSRIILFWKGRALNKQTYINHRTSLKPIVVIQRFWRESLAQSVRGLNNRIGFARVTQYTGDTTISIYIYIRGAWYAYYLKGMKPCALVFHKLDCLLK
jgi:hypothetical protein